MKNYEELKVELLILAEDIVTASTGVFVDGDGDFNQDFDAIWGE